MAILRRNLVTNFGAVPGGSDNSGAWNDFNAWGVANQGSDQILLDVPRGTYPVQSNVQPLLGLRNVIVNGYGAVLNDSGGSSYNLGTNGQRRDDSHSARVATVVSGATSVTLVDITKASLFASNTWALLTGFDLQGLWQSPFGSPTNPAFFEYVYITSIVGAVITFLTPLKRSYKSTWPNYNAGNAFEVDNGGPATLYAIDPRWDLFARWVGITIDQPAVAAGNANTNSNGRDIGFIDVTAIAACPIPSQNNDWLIDRGDWSAASMECDKLVERMTVRQCNAGIIGFQSASINLAIFDAVTARITGSPRRMIARNTTITTRFRPGASGYGNTQEIVLDTCVTAEIDPIGVTDKGIGDAGVNNTYTMSGGVIRVPNTRGALVWATPGSRDVWDGTFTYSGDFGILDVWQDATYTYVQTDLAGGFPAGDPIYIRTHQAPNFTCRNSTGCKDIVDLSQAPGGAPLYSYSKRTYTGDTIVAPTERFQLWGDLSLVTVRVTQAYTGPGTLTLNLFGQFAAAAADPPGYSVGTDWNATVNLKIAGTRTITPVAVTGAQTGDVLTAPGLIRFGQSQGVFASADVSGRPQGEWPIVEIEVTTDQGITRVPTFLTNFV